MIGASQFHSNKIRRDFKDKDQNQIGWVNSFDGFLKGLESFVKQYHTTGLSWNAKGNVVESNSALPSSGAAPPPPKAMPKEDSSSKPTADISSVFNQLNKGEAVTSGLKKVTADMKSKNRADRTGVVSETAAKPTGRLGVHVAAVPKQPPKLELQANKWVVEYQTTPVEINIEDKKQTVYIYKCDNAIVKINGKLNTLTIDSCKKTSVIFEEAISSCEVVNCNGVKIEIKVKVPAVTIDKTSGANVFLSNEGLDTQIFTSKSDEINVSIPGPSEDNPLIEMPIPEQFLSTVVDGKLHTVMNTHLGE